MLIVFFDCLYVVRKLLSEAQKAIKEYYHISLQDTIRCFCRLCSFRTESFVSISRAKFSYPTSGNFYGVLWVMSKKHGKWGVLSFCCICCCRHCRRDVWPVWVILKFFCKFVRDITIFPLYCTQVLQPICRIFNTVEERWFKMKVSSIFIRIYMKDKYVLQLNAAQI